METNSMDGCPLGGDEKACDECAEGVDNQFNPKIGECEKKVEVNKIINGDSLEVLKTMDENSIDLIATDPPYQLSQPNTKKTDKGFMGKEWDVLPSVELLKECLRVLKPGAFSFWLMTPRQDSHMEFLFRLREAGFVISFSPITWCYASGFPKAANAMKVVEKKGLVEKAKELDGAFLGFQPKPCFEVVVVAMKPLSEKSYVDQVLKNGKGVTWLGDGYIPFASEKDKEGTLIGYDQDDLATKLHASVNTKGGFGHKEVIQGDSSRGRFPPNLLVSDDALNNGENTKSSKLDGSSMPPTGKNGVYGLFEVLPTERGFEDEGSYSRYFSLDAWWGEKIKTLPKQMRESVEDVFPFLIVPKPAKSEKNNGCDGLEEKEIPHSPYDRCAICGKYYPTVFTQSKEICGCESPIRSGNKLKNHHPTVKPLELMSYLIFLGSREGDVVLDPFVGSGTTCVSARMWGRKYIGIEREKEYYEIALGRVGEVEKQKTLGDF